MFKRKPKPRDDDVAMRVLDKIQEQSADQREAADAFAEGQAAEEADNADAAIDAYIRSAAAWERHHQRTQFKVPSEPYYRLAILLRKAQALDMEVQVLESYMAHAGRDPDQKLAERLEILAERLEAVDDDEY